jgi:hypothetical protein
VWERRVKSSTVFLQSIRASRTWDIPDSRLDSENQETRDHTFEVESGKMPLKIVDRSKEDLNMKDELVRHSDCVEVLAIADMT